MPKEKKFDFEKAFKQLEEIVEELEAGDLSLEEAIAKFKTGSQLAKDCLVKLRSIELKIGEVVAEEKGGLKRKPFKEE